MTDRIPITDRELLNTWHDIPVDRYKPQASDSTKSDETKYNKYAVKAVRLAELAVEAKLRVTIAGGVKVSQRYQTLFYGLKKNHPHNAALVHPLTFLVRRVAYAGIIIFLYNKPLFASLLLMASSILILCWVLTVSQWEHSLIN